MGVTLVTAEPVTLARLGYVTAVGRCPDIELLGQAADATEAIELIEALQPGVVTVDVDLRWADPGGENGLGLARALRARYPKMGLIVTGPPSDELLVTSLEANLSGYLPRSAAIELLISAIRHAAVSPHSFTAPELAQALARRRQRSALSPREREVFQQLGTGASLTTIARTLSLTESTVRTYVARVYEKLDVRNRAEAARVARSRPRHGA